MRTYCLLVLWLFTSFLTRAQLQNNQPKFDKLFDFRATPYRSASGFPGPEYWQNRADYQIEAELLTDRHRIEGKVTITYTNNSPDQLPFVWLQLDQNKFRADSRGTATTPPQGSRFRADFTNGYELQSVQVDGKDVSYLVNDTRMRIDLPEPMKPKGSQIRISIQYAFDIPEYGADRMGRKKFNNGWVYTIAQWYPRMCVYDDISGWNTEPYLGAGEFYLEYGDFDYKITAPVGVLVLGSGELQNPAEVFSDKEQKAWQQARNSDQTVMIVAESDLKRRAKELPPGRQGKHTWHYVMKNARDVAFGASEAFIVDAARINLPGGKKALAISCYPSESKKGWRRSTEFTKAAIEHYSQMWYEYPYPTAVNVAGIVAGMEYPGVSFCKWSDEGAELWGVTDHEFGHNWFPMIVGTNERLYPWLDEGFNTFINHYSTKAFNKGEFAASDYLQYANRMAAYIFLAPTREAIATYPDVVQDNNLGITAYFKPGYGLLLLREVILGPERFDKAFRTYINTWAFKHPTPIDFFNLMENVAGEELDWFWRGWFYETWALDQAVEKVEYIENDPKKGALVTITNQNELLMPVIMEVKEENGQIHRLQFPVEIWMKGNTRTLRIPTTSRISSLQLDPDRKLMDIDYRNNSWNP